MALQMAGRAPDIWAGVSSWVPITDCVAWHRECVKSGRRYFKDLEKSCGGKPGDNPQVNEQYKKRSPLTWLHMASKVPLDINAGITDGHTGSVPISHSLKAFNLLAEAPDKITEDEINYFTNKSRFQNLFNQRPLIPPMVRIISLCGELNQIWLELQSLMGHEMIPSAIFHWLSKQRKY